MDRTSPATGSTKGSVGSSPSDASSTTGPFSSAIAADVPSRLLLVRRPALDWILQGRKTWEIRGRRTWIRGRIALAEPGTGRVAGVCELRRTLGPLTREQMEICEPLHLAPRAYWSGPGAYRTVYAWVLGAARPLAEPVPFRQPRGAVTWIVLGEDARRALSGSARPDGQGTSVPLE